MMEENGSGRVKNELTMSDHSSGSSDFDRNELQVELKSEDPIFKLMNSTTKDNRVSRV